MTFLPLRKTVLTMAVGLCLAVPAMAEDTVDLDQVLASVNGDDITLGHLLVLRESLPAQYGQLPVDTLFPALLDQLIRQALLAQQEDGSKRIQYSIQNEARAIKADDTARKFFEKPVTEEDLKAAYDERFSATTEEKEYNAAHILVETEEAAADLIKQAQDGADFATLAVEHSTGPSGPNGGDLDWFGAGVMVESFFDAVVALEEGEVTPEPVQTQFGWHLILLKETRIKEQPDFETVRGELEETLRNERFESYLGDLEENTNVERTDLSDFDISVINDASLLEE